MVSLKQKSINGLIWTAAERFGLDAVGLLVTIFLARLLEPSEFGLMGMLAIFTAVAQSIIDSGFGSALIQKKEINQTDASSVFFFNLIVGIILAGLLYLAAPGIAKFYNQPVLAPITRVLSMVLVINPFSLVQTSLLMKTLNFKRLMKVSLISTAASALIAIIMAFQGYGVWSLVVQILLYSLFRAVLLWVNNDWHPSFSFSFIALKTMFSFGSRLMVSGILDKAYQNLYQTFIGKMFSASDLGFFHKAAMFEKGASQSISVPLGIVLFPAMVSLPDEGDAYRAAYRKTIRLAMFIQTPMMIGLFAIAEPLFLLLLTSKWAPSVPYFQIMCIIGLTYPLHSINLNILKVKGRSDLFLKLEIIKKVLTILFIAIFYRWGIMALLYGSLVETIIGYGINSSYSKKLIGYGIWDQLRDIFPTLVSAAVMGFLVYQCGNLVENLLMRLILQLFGGIVTYFLLSLISGREELLELSKILLDLKRILVGHEEIV